MAVTVVGLSLMGLALAGSGGAVQAQEVAPQDVTFSEPFFTLPVGGEGSVRLFNNTTFPLELTLRVGPEDLFDVAASNEVIEPGRSVAVTVGSEDAEEGTEGTLTAVASPTNTDARLNGIGGVDRASFLVGDVAEPLATPEPLVTEWSVTSYRFKPWGSGSDNAVLPLRDAASCDELAAPAGTVGGVSASPGAARVVAQCTDQGASGADTGLALSFPGLASHTGDYTGQIDLATGAEDGAAVDDEAVDDEGAVPALVDLTVRRTDWFLLPLGALLLGAVVAVAAVRAMARTGARAADEREAWLLLARVDEAHRAFRARAQDAPWGAYTFKPDADRRVRALLGDRSWGGPNGSAAAPADDSSPPEHAPAASNGELTAIVAAASGWPLVAERLGELDAAVGELARQAPAHRPPREASSEPACLGAARSLFVGRRLAVDEAVEHAATVDATATLAQSWLGWASALGTLESRIELLALTIDDLPEDHPDRRLLADARAKVASARVDLWEADTMAALEQRDTFAAIGEAQAIVATLSQRVGDGEARESGPGAEAAGPIAPPARSSLQVALARDGDAARTVRGPQTRRHGWWTAVVLVITASVVVASGLSLLYAGRAFGTPRDYLGIFVWGLGGQALLTAAVVGLDRLVGSRGTLTTS